MRTRGRPGIGKCSIFPVFFRWLIISYTVDFGNPVILIISEGFRMLLSHSFFTVNRCASNSEVCAMNVFCGKKKQSGENFGVYIYI